MEIQPFNFNGSDVRAIRKDENPWFIATDVCGLLDLGNVSQAIKGNEAAGADGLDPDEYGITNLDIRSQNGVTQSRSFLIVNESGLYSLVLRSRKPEAKTFKRWITHEVLPAIRKTGSYSMAPRTYAEALRSLADTVEQNERLALENAAMLPKAEFYDAVTESEDTVDFAAAAKLIKVGMGRNTLMGELRKRQILRKDNTPYQEYVDRGYFAVVESTWDKPDGTHHITLKTVVYQKGVEFLRKTLLAA